MGSEGGLTVNEIRNKVDTIEDKLDQVLEKLTSLIRLEERQVAQGDGLKRAHERLDDHETRMRVLERDAHKQGGQLHVSGKVLAAIVALASSIVSGLVVALLR